MNEEARTIVGKLRCAETELKEVGAAYFEEDDFGSAADLIESLSAQLDQVTRERDAAVEDLKYVGKIDGTFCEICKHQPEEDCEKRKFENMDCFEWRGVEEESNA